MAAKLPAVMVEFVMDKTAEFIIAAPAIAATTDEPTIVELVILTLPPLFRMTGLFVYPALKVQLEKVAVPLDIIIKSDWSLPITAFSVQLLNAYPPVEEFTKQ
jgi:hypothetical protein